MADPSYKQLLSQVFDPFMHIPGTVTRRNELIRLGKKLKSLVAKPGFKRADAEKLNTGIQRVTLEQIRLNQHAIKPPRKN